MPFRSAVTAMTLQYGNGSAETTVVVEGQKSGCSNVGSSTRWELTSRFPSIDLLISVANLATWALWMSNATVDGVQYQSAMVKCRVQ